MGYFNKFLRLFNKYDSIRVASLVRVNAQCRTPWQNT